MQVFVQVPKRKEAVLTIVYDGGSVLNCSDEVTELREMMKDMGVSIIESQGPAALVMGLVCSPSYPSAYTACHQVKRAARSP